MARLLRLPPASAARIWLLLATTVQISAALPGAPSSPLELCSATPRPVRLAAGSADSSVSLDLRAPSGRTEPCVLRVSVPDINLLDVHILASRQEEPESGESSEQGDVDVEVLELLDDNSSSNASCVLKLMVDDKLLHSVDLCDAESVRAAKHLVKQLPQNITFVWTPASPASLQADTIVVTASRKGVPSYDLCSVTRTLRPAPHGLDSALLLELRGAPDGRPCQVNVAAPDTHLLSVLLVPKQGTPAREAADRGRERRPASCRFSLMLWCGEKEPWSVDLCDPNAAAVQSALHFTELFPPNVTLVWTPPSPEDEDEQMASAVLLTAIGKGKMCSGSQFYPCWRRARFQPLCVATALACDGYHNCPMDGNDEDPLMCLQNDRDFVDGVNTDNKEERGSSGAAALVELIKQAIQSNSNRHTHNQSFHVEESSQQDLDPTPDTLSNYGPWGYLMLGMLVCGAFLMLCGLWECCCRQPKPSPSTPSHTPTTVLMPSASPGSVLALDSDLDDDPSRPPAYEDLDQPPAYGALFPGQPKDDPVSAPAALMMPALVPALAPVLVGPAPLALPELPELEAAEPTTDSSPS